MKNLIGLAALAASMLGAPASAAPAPVPPPSGGTIAITAETGDGEYHRSMPAFVDALGKALTARGFTVFDDPAHASSVVELILSRSNVGTGLGKDPHPDKTMIGPGVIVPFSTGDSHLAMLLRTKLELRIHARSQAVVWDGAAVTVRQADTGTGTDQAVATDLVAALLRTYPAVPRDVIGVP